MEEHSDDIENGRGGAQGSQQSKLGQFNQLSDEIQLQIDELEEILKEVSQLQHLTPSERPVQLRLKNAYKELQNEYNQIKVSDWNQNNGHNTFRYLSLLQKLIKTQMKMNQMKQPSSRNTNNLSNRRIRGLAQESSGLDRTLDLTNEIMAVGG